MLHGLNRDPLTRLQSELRKQARQLGSVLSTHKRLRKRQADESTVIERDGGGQAVSAIAFFKPPIERVPQEGCFPAKIPYNSVLKCCIDVERLQQASIVV